MRTIFSQRRGLMRRGCSTHRDEMDRMVQKKGAFVIFSNNVPFPPSTSSPLPQFPRFLAHLAARGEASYASVKCCPHAIARVAVRQRPTEAWEGMVSCN